MTAKNASYLDNTQAEAAQGSDPSYAIAFICVTVCVLTSCCVYAFWTHFSDLAVGCLFAVQLLALYGLCDAARR